MEQWRIDEFRRNTKRPFPFVRTMPAHEAMAVGSRLLSRLGLGGSFGEPQLWSKLEEALNPLAGIKATESTFCLTSALDLAAIRPGEELCIWWQQEDDEVIDVMKTVDIVREFRWIWRPASDDIDLFDMSMSWLVRVDHSGLVWALSSTDDPAKKTRGVGE